MLAGVGQALCPQGIWLVPLLSPLTQETWAGRCPRGRAEGKQMISPFDLENVPTGSPSYNPSAKVTTLQRRNTSLSLVLAFPFRLKFVSESNFCLSLNLISFT